MVQVIDSPSAGGPRGAGQVEVIDATHIRVTLQEKEKAPEVHVLEYPQGVEMVKIGNWQLQNAVDVYINLTPDKLDIKYIRPRNGMFYVVFSRFGAEEGELPTITYKEGGYPYQGAKWENPARYKCYPLYEIINPGMYEGMELLDILTYEWEYDHNLDDWALVGSERRKWHDHVVTVLNVFGFDLQNDTFHYTGEQFDGGGPETIANVLPELEDIFQSRKKLAQVTVKDGWIQTDTIGPGPFGMSRESLVAAMSGPQLG